MSEAKISASEVFEIAESLYLQGNYEETIALYDRGLKIDPLAIDILSNKAVAVSKLTPDFADRDTKNTSTSNVLLYGTPYDQAIKIDPDNIQLLTNAGIYLADKKGMYTHAISLFDKVLEIDPNHAPAIYNKGLALDKLGKHDEAVMLLDRAKEIDFDIGPGFGKPEPSFK